MTADVEKWRGIVNLIVSKQSMTDEKHEELN